MSTSEKVGLLVIVGITTWFVTTALYEMFETLGFLL